VVNRAPIERNLDTLRSVAVLTVFLAHLELAVNLGVRWFWGMDMWTVGRAGVLMFFVHTSLVLMLSMERMQHVGSSMVWRFYVRRLFRIYPLSILCCVLLSVFAIPRNVLGATFVWNWRLFASNLLLIQNITGDKLLTDPLWSLPYEVQMYLALPLIFLALRSTRRAFVLAFLSGAAVLGGWRVPLFEFVPCFMAGICAFMLLRVRRALFPWWCWPAVLLLVLIPYCLYDPSRVTPRKSWTFCVFLSVMVPFFGDCLSPPIAWVSHMIARYSYGIYLCHYPLMWIFYRRLATLPGGVRHALYAASIVVLPIVCYHFIEAPLIKLGIRISEAGHSETKTTKT